MSHESLSWPPPSPPPPVPEPPKQVSFTFGSEVFLRTAGLGLLVLAVLFVVSTAFTRGWIGPEIQLLGAGGVGVGLLRLGDWLRPRERSWGIALSAGGILALLATAASTLFGEQFGSDVAYGAIATVAAVGYAVAWHQNGSAIASSALIGGAVGWLVVDGPIPFLATLAVATVAVATAAALAEVRCWASLRPLSLAVAGLSLPILAVLAETETDRLLVGVVAAVFGVVCLLAPRRALGNAGWWILERQAVSLVGPWLVGVGRLLIEVEDRQLGIAALAVGVLFLVLALATEGIFDGIHRNSVVISAGLCIALGLGQLLDGPALLLGIALESVGLLWSRCTLGAAGPGGDARLLVGAILLAVPSAMVLAALTTEAWASDAPWGDDVLHLLVALALGVAGWLMGRPLADLTAPAAPLYGLVWLGSVLVHLPQGQVLVSLSWAAVGLALLIGGALLRRRLALSGGIVVIVVTVGKLLTIDLAEVDTLWRAALFFVIGAGMLRTAYALPGLVDRSGDTEPVNHS